MLDFNLNFIIALFFGILFLYLLLRILYLPLRIVARFLINSIMGGILLLLFNTILGSWWGTSLGINVVTAVLTGFLGIPGVFFLLLLQRITA